MKQDRAAILIEFDGADALLRGVTRLRQAGHVDIDVHSPYRLPELEEPLGLRRGWLPLLVFAAAGAGATASYGIQYITNVLLYPLNAGGRPAHAVPSFLFSTVEGTFLTAGLAALLLFLITTRLPRLWQPVFEVARFESASSTGFWVRVPGLDPDDAPALVDELGAARWERVEVHE
jgi:hypothetical protein